jgi:hypothetical protein
MANTHINLPPEGIFDSFDALFESVQTQGISVGCAYIIGKSKHRKGRWIRFIAYKRGGKERPRIDNKDFRI